jgi:hypothetical protein
MIIFNTDKYIIFDEELRNAWDNLVSNKNARYNHYGHIGHRIAEKLMD